MMWAAPFSSPSRPDLRGQTRWVVLKVGVVDLDPRVSYARTLAGGQGWVIERVLPASGRKGRPPGGGAIRVINGLLFKAKTGVAWRDPPARYGPWRTVSTTGSGGGRPPRP
ncbi:transposase [Streptoalloteichus tenebrarius]|uniref:transposase n=2 Tax=Streptoalloteichus tenebrarius (strain ATCC 17920 / DSM 40477 / JCM 4838 / CBS 697.72 / NBRC 16177 / NCIMB 11028 / NRRL B-12390 / A12253. 1 / ISP 5477) TaxID=1933 RepID=UPI0035EE4F28